MTAEKIDWQRLAMEAGDLAQDDVDCGLIGSGDWAFRRDKHFARLMLEEAAKVCDVTPPQPFRPSIEAAHAIRSMMP